MANFNFYIDKLDMNFWREFCIQEGELRYYKKGEYFLRHGEVAKYFGFIESGYFKYSMIDTDGNRHITGFALCHTFAGDYYGSMRKVPALTDLVAATNSAVWVCSVNLLKPLIEEHLRMFHFFVEELFHEAYKRYTDLYLQSPKERYLALLQRCPDILQNVTLKELASYLNVTPTHLSRIRKEITFEK